MPPGAQSHNHHERADEIRAELSKLETLYKDGVLDHATYVHGCEKCWKGCYSVRLMRGVAYTGEIEVDLSSGLEARASRVPDEVVLEFYRPSLKKQVLVELPRPENKPRGAGAQAQGSASSAPPPTAPGEAAGGEARAEGSPSSSPLKALNPNTNEAGANGGRGLVGTLFGGLKAGLGVQALEEELPSVAHTPRHPDASRRQPLTTPWSRHEGAPASGRQSTVSPP